MRILQNARSHNSVDIQPLGPLLNPVTPAAISRLGNRIELTDENRYVFPRASEEEIELSPGFSSALRQSDVDYYWLSFGRFRRSPTPLDDGVSEQATKNTSRRTSLLVLVYLTSRLENERTRRGRAFSLYRTYKPSILIKDDKAYRSSFDLDHASIYSILPRSGFDSGRGQTVFPARDCSHFCF